MPEINAKLINESLKELIAIGASVGAHCQPCLEYHIRAALDLGVTKENIRQAVEIGHKVEKGAMVAMKKHSASVIENIDPLPQQPESANQTREKETVMKIYDPAMCCSSGVCGPSVDPVLAQFAGTLKMVSGQPSVRVERYNLGQQPQAFVENEQVKSMLGNGGERQLPFIFIDDRLWLQGRYPSKEELLVELKIEVPVEFAISQDTENSPCCGDGGCC